MNQLAESIAALRAEIAHLKIQIAAQSAARRVPPMAANDQEYRQAVNDRIDRIMAQLTPEPKFETREAA